MSRIFLLKLMGAFGVVLFSSIVPNTIASDTNKPNYPKKELALIQNQLNELDIWFEATDQKLRDSLKKIKEHDEEVSAISQKQESLVTDLTSLKGQLNRIENDELIIKERSEKHLEQLLKHATAAQRLDDSGYLRAIFGQNIQAIPRTLRYHRHIGAAHLEKLVAYRITSEELDKKRQELDLRSKEYKNIQHQLLQNRSELSRKREETEAIVLDLEKMKATKRNRRSELETDGLRLRALLKELQEETFKNTSTDVLTQKGRLNWPINGQLFAKFGSARSNGYLTWQGLMIQAPEGRPIRAIFSGKVVCSNWLRGYGLLTIMDHGNDIMSLYGQTESIIKRKGDWVEAGELIATAGKSGGESRSGLYIEIREKGKAVNPLEWLNGPPQP